MEDDMHISRDFRIALKMSDTPQYKTAIAAGLNPATLSKLLHGAAPLQPDDPRIIRVGELLGLTPDQCFDENRV